MKVLGYLHVVITWVSVDQYIRLDNIRSREASGRSEVSKAKRSDAEQDPRVSGHLKLPCRI
jgi:hypothetical protein